MKALLIKTHPYRGIFYLEVKLLKSSHAFTQKVPYKCRRSVGEVHEVVFFRELQAIV